MLKVAVFNTRRYERAVLERAAEGLPLSFTFLEARLDVHTAVLAEGHGAVLIFVNDTADRDVLARLAVAGEIGRAHV